MEAGPTTAKLVHSSQSKVPDEQDTPPHRPIPLSGKWQAHTHSPSCRLPHAYSLTHLHPHASPLKTPPPPPHHHMPPPRPQNTHTHTHMPPPFAHKTTPPHTHMPPPSPLPR